MTIKLGIDMGSTTTTIFRQNSGLVLREPSKVLCEMDNGKRIVREVGQKAIKLLGKTPEHVSVVSPIVDGVVDDVHLASRMLVNFVDKVISDNPGASTYALINIPCGASIEECKKTTLVACRAHITAFNLIPNVIACAVGAGVDLTSDQCVLVVDIGGGCTDIAVVGYASIIHGVTLNIGSGQMDIAIQRYIEEKFGINISPATAEMLKEEIGSLLSRDIATMQVNGVDVATKELRSVVVNAGLICDAIQEYYEIIADTISEVLSQCTPETMSNVLNFGVVLCGKATKITGLENFMVNRLGVKVNIVEGDCTANGLGMLLDNRGLVKRIVTNNRK
ncbi:MAG: rod shape-determining protein [Clostridia bacterium]|nr:rod shape-determining protein [Clostridia bacterium]